MKQKKVFELVKKELNTIKFELKYDGEESVEFQAEIRAKDLYDDILVDGEIYSTGAIHMYFTFDTMEPTLANLMLLNDFNADNPWFKAYIVKLGENEVPFLKLACDVPFTKNEKQAALQIQDIFSELVSERTRNQIKILIEDTETDIDGTVA